MIFAPTSTKGELPLVSTMPNATASERKSDAVTAVGAVSHDSSDELEDAIREDFIRNCGRQMLACMSRWEAYGDFADRGEAMFWLNEQTEAIKARSPAFVRKMELEHGLA